ncbi:putative cleavage and polyadenylation specificity factor subunit 4-like protein [Bubalus bubalis]|uniref:putative cleavage and polyadenylation specificity factor subunit 4-like protein n=1 Tax=Bubalus bubalis TaxID=89462 RepID=UPI001E1B8294|nr:putative cleavage and polyadenylation specificity factor subunit 4-like protein [Bubalus bubalis]
MPKCHFSFKSGDCSNKERPFLHVKPAFKTQDCPGDDRGFCKHGPLCKYRHVRRTKCTNYLKLAPARKDPGTNLHTCQAAPGVRTSSCLGTKRGPLPDKSACLLILRRGPVSRGLPTAWGSGAGAGRATGCRARPSCCGGSSLAAELALRVTGTPLQLWSSPFMSRGLLFSCGARPSRRRGSMLGVDLKAFLRPNKELHLRVEARFLMSELLQTQQEWGLTSVAAMSQPCSREAQCRRGQLEGAPCSAPRGRMHTRTPLPALALHPA